jgi:hypothetical protein
MKTNKRDLRHELLSDLHRLLSIASAEDFLAASRLCKSENIKLALEALAEEHLAETHSRKRVPVRSTPSGRYVRRSASKPQANPQSAVGNIQEVLNNSPHFANKSDLLRFAASQGIEVRADPKESRSRIIARIMKQIDKFEPNRRLEIFLRASQPNDRQTEGWLQVIRGR